MVDPAGTAAAAADACHHFGLQKYVPAAGDAAPAHQGADVGTWGHMRHIVRQEGVQGLWKGNTARMMKVAPA